MNKLKQHRDRLAEALNGLDRLEAHMNKHGEFGSNGPWDVTREFSKYFLTLIDKQLAGEFLRPKFVEALLLEILEESQ